MKYVSFINKKSMLAVVPDLNYISASGKNIDEAFINIQKEAYKFLKNIENFPKARTKKELIRFYPEYDGAIARFIRLKPPSYS